MDDNMLHLWAWRVIDHAGAREHLSEDLTTAALLGDEIERRGLGAEYARALLLRVSPAIDQIGPASYHAVLDDIWRVLRATPEQHARAFLKVINE